MLCFATGKSTTEMLKSALLFLITPPLALALAPALGLVAADVVAAAPATRGLELDPAALRSNTGASILILPAFVGDSELLEPEHPNAHKRER